MGATMNKVILIFIFVLGLAFYFSGKMGQKAFEDCMAAGVQSEETCRYYAMQ